MERKAHAKINLSLDVIGKREDGYHELDMVFLEISLHDIVRIEHSTEPGIFLACGDPSLENEKNLAYRAAQMMFDRYCEGAEEQKAGVLQEIKNAKESAVKNSMTSDKDPQGVKISIRKNIPMQAGLGGGSTDAAAVLVGMNELFGFGASAEELRALGKQLGADVPFFITGGCARAGGIGEKLEAIGSLPPFSLLLVKPEEGISTAYAYGNLKYGAEAFHPDIEGLVQALKEKDLKKAASLLGNSLEAAVTDRYPVISSLKESLMQCGALGSLMTGSGSAVFGLFEKEEQAKQASERMKERFPKLQTFVCTPCV